MWLQYLSLVFCAFVVVNSSPQGFNVERESFPKSQETFKSNEGFLNQRQNNENLGLSENNKQYESNLSQTRPSTTGGNTIGGTHQNEGGRGSLFAINSTENSLSRPSGGFSQSLDNRDSSNSTGGFGSTNKGNSFDKPTNKFFQTTDQKEGQNRPFESSGNNGNFFTRLTNNYQEGRNPLNEKEQKGRPTDQQASFTPDHLLGGSTQRPGSSEQREQNQFSSGSGHREQNQFSSESGHGGQNQFPSGSGHREQNQFSSESGHGGQNQFPSGSGHREQNQFSSASGHGGQNQFSSGSGHGGQNQFSSESGHGGQNQFSSASGHGGQNQFSSESGHVGQNQFSSEAGHSGNSNKENERVDKEEEKDVCFGNLGCFKMGKPWKSALRPIGPPQGPEKIQTTLHFYSRQNPEKPINITVYPQINTMQAPFDPSKITAIIVHGFSNSGNASWMRDMKDVYLKKVDANVMIVDWGKGAQLLNYLQVAGNTRVVGKQLGVFVQYLIDNYRADPGKFHLIGHSLGAQICSYLGKEVKGIARLTALDPAQPGFEGFDRELRLDKTDAEFVDVIHTDARPFIPTLGFGMIAPHGHVDFYMNGGFDQPGCVPPSKKELPTIKSFLDFAKYPVEVIAKTIACPHARAYEYLIESFNETENCIFWGHKADVKNVFKSVTNTVTQGLLKKLTTLSPTCSKEDCIPVGFATKKSPLRGVFVVTTNGRAPYCISEPGIPPETPPQERTHESFIQKIGKKTRIIL